MNYNELHEKYIELQSIPLSKMTIKERNKLQFILEQLINNTNSSEYDLQNYFRPKFNNFKNDIRQIKQYIAEEIAKQEAVIIIAQNKIKNIKNKLVVEGD